MTEQPTTEPTTPADVPADVWTALAAPFDTSWIEKLPKQLKKGDENRGRCEENSYASADGHYCGGWHARSVHLDYIGHAGITMRLNSVVGPAGWTLEPVAITPEGLPLMARGEFWAKLVILGVEKVDLAANFNSTQEAWGDALRRCAMRFGIGTYLWAKSEYAAELAAYRGPTDTRAQELADAINAGQVTELDAAERAAAAAGYLDAIIRLGDAEGTLRAYIAHSRPHVIGSGTPPAATKETPSAPQEPAQAPTEAPAPAPAPEEAPAPAPAPQDGTGALALEFARAILEEGTEGGLREVWNMAKDNNALDANVIAVVGDDDLAALGVDPRTVGDTIPLGGLLMRARAYVTRHGAAIRDLGEPATTAQTVEEPVDPWAVDADTPQPVDPRD